MIIREKTPAKILINVDFLKSAISSDKSMNNAEKEYENNKNILLAAIGGLASCLLTIIPSWNSWGWPLRITIIIFSFCFLGWLIWSGIKAITAKRKYEDSPKQELYERIIDEAKKKVRYTALLVICYQKSKTGEVVFMTEKQGNYLVHCDMDPSKQVVDQRKNIINYLATTYSVQENHVIDILPITEEPFFSIKPIHSEETQNGFVFFQVKLKKKAKQGLTNHRDVFWMSLQQMEGTPELMGRNQDIVMALNEIKPKISYSFEDAYGPLHIIWNITQKCPYSCAICATRDNNRRELSTEDKLKVLNHIFSAKEKINVLDFAGGDPMYDDGVRTVITHAINVLGDEHVSVTTTGKGIQAMEISHEEEISKLLKRCEITIDASHENLSSIPSGVISRNSPEYCKHNYEQIQNTSENLQFLMINIPLINDDLNDEELDNLVSRLVKLKNNYTEIKMEAQIIRLMPVGAFNNSEAFKKEYKNYDPIRIAKTIKSRITDIGIPCRYHCSLRVLSKIGPCNTRCNMLDKKIGIDCSGNVFACTWGAYLQMPCGSNINQNPFYLGNLVQSSLKSILDGQSVKTMAYKRIMRDISNKTNKPYCEAVSWYFNNTLEENHDPLSI